MLKKYLFILVTLCYLLLTTANAASVRATVDTVEVVKGNPITLRIKATGGSADFPNISTVAKAPVVGTSSSSSRSLSMVNGSVTSEVSTTKSIQFVPQKDMTIPSYAVTIDGKVYKTDPIAIKVVKSQASKGNNNQLFSLRMKSNKTKVSVGESFVVSVYFSLRADVQLSQEVQFVPPSMSDFVVADAAEQAGYRKGNYQVEEVRYIVTPQKEGNFTIGAARAKIGVPDRSRRDFLGMTFGTKWYQSASNTLDIEVLPQAKDSDLVGNFRVETHIDSQEVKANKPVNLTVRITGNGSLESFEFPKYEIDGVTIYSDEAKVKTKVIKGKLFSTYEKSFAFIADEDFSIPSRTFTMLDVKDKTIKELKVKGFDVKVTKAKSANAVLAKQSTKGVVQTNVPQTEPAVKEVIVEKKVEVKSVSWWMLVLSFLVGMGVMYGLRFMPKKKAKPYKESEALKILYAHMSDDAEVEEMVRKLYAKKNGDKSVEIDKKRLKQMVEKYRK